MLAFPQWHSFTAEYCTEPVTYFRSWIVMLAFPQWHLFAAQYCTEYVTYFSVMNCHAGLSTVTLIYSWILHWTCNLFFSHELSCWPFHSDTYLQLNTALNLWPIFAHEMSCWPFTVTLIYIWILHWIRNLFSLMNCHAGLSTVTLIYSSILHWTCNLFFPHEMSCWPFTMTLTYSSILHWTCNLLFSHEMSCWPFHNDAYLQLNTALNL